jgi:hypothetical protein
MSDAAVVLSRAGLDDLVAALIADGRTVIGPTVRDDAIVLAELTSGDQLPAGRGVALDRALGGSWSWRWRPPACPPRSPPACPN